MNDRRALHHRRSIRLPEYDYSQSGVYFVTICAQGRECLFGEVMTDSMVLSPIGRIVEDVWLALPCHFAHIELDAFIVMPNHFHGLVQINAPHSITKNRDEQTSYSSGTQSQSLAALVQNFKSVTTRKINQMRQLSGKTVWQRNYYERVIRNQRELDAKHQYITNNPMQWALDEENPLKPKRTRTSHR
jgi:REP element-mobilizing transposase RayT